MRALSGRCDRRTGYDGGGGNTSYAISLNIALMGAVATLDVPCDRVGTRRQSDDAVGLPPVADGWHTSQGVVLFRRALGDVRAASQALR